MKTLIKAFDFLSNLALLLMAALLGSLAFPSELSAEGFPFIAFFMLLPVFVVVYRAPWTVVGIYGAWYGFWFYFLHNYWLSTFHPLAILITPSLASLEYFVLFYFMKAATKAFPRRSWIPLTFVYNAYLYLGQQFFLAYPYGNVASAVYGYTSLIQIASVTGIWGLSLLITIPQAITAEAIVKKDSFLLYELCLSVLSILLVAGGGYLSLVKERHRVPDRVVRIAAVQHPADTWVGGYDTYRDNFLNLKRLTLEAMEENPDLVVWSETAFVPSVAWHKEYPTSYLTSRLCNDFVSFGENLGVPLVTGNPEGVINDPTMAPILDSGDWNWKTYNTVIFFGEGGIMGTYRKQHLVPFTEYFPYEKELPRVYELLEAHDYKWWEKGEESTVFHYDGVGYSTPICFEDMFGYLNAEFVRNGAQVLLNLSNDYWSRSVQAEAQHMEIAVFRAVENRVPLVRSTNSGITCMVLPTGEIVDPLEPFTLSWHVYEVPVRDDGETTFYTRHPDLFGKAYVALALCLLLHGLVSNLLKFTRKPMATDYSPYDNIFMKEEREAKDISPSNIEEEIQTT